MESKSNKFLIGLICIILGIYFVANEYFDFKIGDAALLIWGGAFLLLYWTKRKVWALVIGMITYVVLIFRLFPHLAGGMLASMIFIVPGIIFMVLYFSNRRNSFLITGSVFTWLGVFIFLTSIQSFYGMGCTLFFICMGIAFLTMYLLSRNEMGKWPLFPAMILIVFGVIVYFGKSPFIFIFSIMPSVIPLIFIILGVCIIVKSIISKK